MPSKIKMLSIELEQATGTFEECKRRAKTNSWEDVDPILRRWDSDRPEKVDYRIHFEDGEIMQGTVEIGPAEENYGFRSFKLDVTRGLRTLMSLDPEKAAFRRFIDKTGEKRLQAIAIGAKYDFECDTSEPAVADASILRDYLDEDTEGRDAEVASPEDGGFPMLVFADGQGVEAVGIEAAKYLQRQWRIMNNIHPIHGGEVKLIEAETEPRLAH